jgi:predicted Zn-dependent protease
LFQIAAGDHDEGISQLKRVIEMNPSFTPPYETLWQTYHFDGDGAHAFENFLKQKEVVGAKPDAISQFKDAYARAGWPAVLRTELDLSVAADSKGEFSGRKYYIATIAALIGDNDTAIEYLEQSLHYRLIGMSWIKVDPRLDSLRSDPRFQDILRRSGFSGA